MMSNESNTKQMNHVRWIKNKINASGEMNQIWKKWIMWNESNI